MKLFHAGESSPNIPATAVVQEGGEGAKLVNPLSLFNLNTFNLRVLFSITVGCDIKCTVIESPKKHFIIKQNKHIGEIMGNQPLYMT